MTETSSKFEIGDQIEFCSGENSGMWKTGLIHMQRKKDGLQ